MILYLILTLATMFGVIAITSAVSQRLAYVIIGFWICSMLFSAIMFGTMLGTPKLTIQEFRKIEVAQVLWSKVIVNEKILLILTWKGLPEPLYYSMPWSKELEKELSQAQSRSAARNTPIMLRNPFSFKSQKHEGDGKPGNGKGKGTGTGSQGEGNEEQDFYVAPPPPSPAKDVNNLTEGST